MKRIFAFFVASLLAAPASAVEWHVMGPRALGMGGAGVAAAKGPIASYWNPAALGRQTGNAYGVEIPLGVHIGMTGKVIEGANNLQNIKNCGASCTQADVDRALNDLDEPGNGFRADAGFGVHAKILKSTVFLNGFTYVGAVPQVDRTNATLAAIQAGTNNSKLVVKGANIAELGAAYGSEIPGATGLFLGGAVKVMSATVGYADYFILREGDDQGNIISKLKDGARRSSNIGLDAGLLYDFDRAFGGVALKPRVGLVGRNLNNPLFKVPAAASNAGITSFKVNPQVRLGTSIQPLNWWTVAADADLTRNLTPVDRVASRHLSLGNEFNVFNRPWLNIPLRVGLLRNLEEPGTMFTAGAGLNFLHFLVDVSAAVSPKRAQLDSTGGKNEKVPREASIALQLSFLFGGAEPEAPAREWKKAPPVDDQPVPTEKIKAAAEKAQKELDAEEAKKAPVYSPR